jgi:hypothetical protein
MKLAEQLLDLFKVHEAKAEKNTVTLAKIKNSLKKQVALKNIDSNTMSKILAFLGSEDSFEKDDIETALRKYVDSGSTRDIIFISIFTKA